MSPPYLHLPLYPYTTLFRSIFAMANPNPEIMPDTAKAAGASIIGTGRSDLPNQINNVLAFPGIFRGALDVRAKHIDRKSTRLNSSHVAISYAVFCLKKNITT